MRSAAERWLRAFRWEKSNSRPTWNMSRTSPSPESICSGSGMAERNTVANASGASQPNSEGPRAIPMRISPTTAAWPKRFASAPPIRPAITITASSIKVKNRSVSVL